MSTRFVLDKLLCYTVLLVLGAMDYSGIMFLGYLGCAVALAIYLVSFMVLSLLSVLAANLRDSMNH